MRPEEITLAVFEKYKPEEMVTTAQQMAQAQADMEAVESEKKVSDAAFKERINTLSASVSDLAHKYNKGGETAQIGCKIRYDIPAAGKKSYIRFDTEEVVEVHDMTETEKQETFQFPLAATPEAPKTPTIDTKPEEQRPAKPEPKPAPEKTGITKVLSGSAAEISYRDIHNIAENIVRLENQYRQRAIDELRPKIATMLAAQKTVIGPDGRVEAIASPEMAAKLADSWLAFAIDELQKPKKVVEEVTRLCPYPGCRLFMEHEGDHDVASPEKQTASDEPQPQREPEKKPRRKRPNAEPPAPGAPQI